MFPRMRAVVAGPAEAGPGSATPAAADRAVIRRGRWRYRVVRLSRHGCLLFVLLAVGAGGTAVAQPWPPVAGELSGGLQWRALAGAPPVTWRVQLAQPGPDGVGRALGDVRASGLDVQAEGTTDGGWRLTVGEMDLATWSRPLLAAAGVGAPGDLVLLGTLRFEGEGTWVGTGVEGRLRVTLANGRASSANQGWEADGLELVAQIALASDGSLAIESMTMRAATLQAAGMAGRDLQVELVGRIPGEIEVRRAEVAILGGTVRVRPFRLDPERPEIRATADLAAIALDEVAALLPTALAGARGRLEGRVEVAWSEAAGFRPQGGALRVAADAPASLRLASTPGFLTQHLPERIRLLPDWLRLPPTWLAPVNPAYGTLEKIERGEQDLTVEQLRVELYPDGPDGPRSATVEVAARPASGSAVERVSFTVNVAGPLQQVLEIGLDERARLNFNAKPK